MAIDLRISEGLRKAGSFMGSNRGGVGGSALGNFAVRLSNTIENPKNKYSKRNQPAGLVYDDKSIPADKYGKKNGGVVDFSASRKAPSPSDTSDQSVKKMSLADLTSGAVNAGAASRARRNAITGDWGDAQTHLSNTGKSLNAMGTSIDSLGRVRDQYLKANDTLLQKSLAAADGNRQLIRKNQEEDIRDLEGDTRRSLFSGNSRLGAGAASSAAGAMAQAISRQAGKQRRDVLMGYGDQLSTTNQQEQNAREQFTLNRAAAYEWEKTQRQRALDEYNSMRSELAAIKKRAPQWMKQDIEDEDDRRLSSFLGKLNQISATAKAFRDGLYDTVAAFGGSVSELENAGIPIDAPAELDTPEFSTDIDIPGTPDGDPATLDQTKQKQRKVIGMDALGNPIYDDEVVM